MNSKSNKSYKLRTKQMAIHIRAFGQIDKPIVTTKIEDGLFTIEDLRNGKCAVINDANVIILQDVLGSAFPKDASYSDGTYKYYFAGGEYGIWTCDDDTNLLTQSAIKFFNQINK